MIRHTILFKVKPHTVSIAAAIEKFLQLKNILPGIISIVGGKCLFHDDQAKEKMNKLFTHAISIDFENAQALRIFFDDPITHPAKEMIINITEGGYNGIFSFELEN